MSVSNLLELCAYLDVPNTKTIQMVHPLTEQVNDVSPGGGSALHFVALGKNLELAAWLFVNGAKFCTNEYEETPLHWACRGGHVPMVKLFLRNMTYKQIIAKDHQGKTAFDWATAFQLEEIAYLIDRSTTRTARFHSFRVSVHKRFQHFRASKHMLGLPS